MIIAKFTTPFEVHRNVWTQVMVNGKQVDRTVEAVELPFNGYKQQATAEYAQAYNLTLSKAYTVWCPLSAKVAEGDTVVADEVQYTVRARREYKDGCNPHAELAVEMIGVIESEPDGSS